MEEFCDRVLRENSGRAVREKLPLSYRQAKERWRDCVEEETGRDGAGQQARAEDARKEEKKGSKGGGGGNGNRLRDGMRDGRVAAVDGDGPVPGEPGVFPLQQQNYRVYKEG